MARLKTACESAKRLLSTSTFATIEVDNLHADIDFECKITLSRFNDLCNDLVEKTLGPVKQALADAKLQKTDITEVVMVGGSTRIPFVQKHLKSFFNRKKLMTEINADEAVAYGATLQAALLSNVPDPNVRNIQLLDVIPHSLGIKAQQDHEVNIFSIVLNRNTRFPVERTQRYSTTFDNQTCVGIKVYEGENPLATENRFLGSFNLLKIAPAPARVPDLMVTFRINENGILKVTCVDQTSGNSNSIEIFSDNGRLNQAEIFQMIDHNLGF
uniref:Heat shock protein 70 n=1 Tax=Panagrolaimus superbus TaxID=310955 RepID=A0A914XYW5_9BILA